MPPITDPRCIDTANSTTQIACLEPLFARFIGWVAGLAGIAFMIMFIVGGYKYLFSGGDPKKAEAAKGTLTAAFLGLILIVSAYLILNIISSITGFNLTTFQIVNFP